MMSPLTLDSAGKGLCRFQLNMPLMAEDQGVVTKTSAQEAPPSPATALTAITPSSGHLHLGCAGAPGPSWGAGWPVTHFPASGPRCRLGEGTRSLRSPQAARSSWEALQCSPRVSLLVIVSFLLSLKVLLSRGSVQPIACRGCGLELRQRPPPQGLGHLVPTPGGRGPVSFPRPGHRLAEPPCPQNWGTSQRPGPPGPLCLRGPDALRFENQLSLSLSFSLFD